MEQVVQVPKGFSLLGGLENAGSKGGYRNYQVRHADLWAYECVQRWLRKRADTTRSEYLKYFPKFLKWASVQAGVQDPDGLLAWARSQPSGVMVQDFFDEYVETISKPQGHVVMAVLRSFLARNGYRDLPKIDWDSTVSFTEGFKRDQIQELLGYLDQPLQKLYVLAAKDSGLRANDLLYIRYKYIAEDLEVGKDLVHIRFEKERYQRRKAPGRTFLGPNSLTLLRQLIKEGKVRTDPEAKLFPFAYRSITHGLTLAKRKARLDPKIQPSHGLRKFYENCLDRVGMDHNKKLQLEGHSQGVRNAYTSRDVEELRKLYEQAYQFLDLSEEAVVDSRFKDLEKALAEKTQHIEALKAELAKSSSRDAEIEEIRKELRRQREKLEELGRSGS